MDFSSTSLGYILDLFATIFIVFSIVFRSKRRIGVDSETLYGGNPFVYESQLRSFWDGWIGIIIFFIGTVLHLFHFQLGIRNFILVLILTIILLIILRLIIIFFIKRDVRKRYKHYDSVKKAMDEGKYDTYPK
ncbi:MAG: hypothetical protein WCW93_01460 [Candidatus Paceibacterota bacterium]